jgi:hypothetical protein
MIEMDPAELQPKPDTAVPVPAPDNQVVPVSGMSQQTKSIIVVILLLSMFIFPLTGVAGVILMWKWMHWKTYRKVLATLTFLFSGIIVIILAASVFVISFQ